MIRHLNSFLARGRGLRTKIQMPGGGGGNVETSICPVHKQDDEYSCPFHMRVPPPPSPIKHQNAEFHFVLSQCTVCLERKSVWVGRELSILRAESPLIFLAKSGSGRRLCQPP